MIGHTRIRKAFARHLRSAAAVALFVVSGTASAQISVSPSRLWLSDHQLTSTITLKYQGTQSAQFKVQCAYYEMLRDGSQRKKTTPIEVKDRSLCPWLILSPARVQLAPGQEQVIRVLSRAPSTLPQADYRAHLEIVSSPETSEPSKEAQKKKEPPFKIVSEIAFALPILYRHGSAGGAFFLTEPKLITLASGESGVSVKASIIGPRFLYGDLWVFLLSDIGTARQIGEISGVSSYIPSRVMQFPLKDNEIGHPRGTIRIELHGPREEQGQLYTFGEAKLP